MIKMNLQRFAEKGDDNKGTDIKELLTNIEKGVKESGTKFEGFEKNFKELKDRVDEMEVKAQRINSAPGIETKEKYFPGQKAARLWKCQIIAQQEKKSINEVVENIYGNDEVFLKEVKSLMAGGDAGQLIETQYYQEILPLLYNKLIITTLGSRRVPMPKGNITIRKMISGSTASYVGETKGPKASSAKFAALRLASKKLVVKVPFSNDLLRDASPEADRIVRDDMILQLQIAMDYHSLYGLGTEFSPLGIAYAKGINKINKTAILDGDTLYADLVTPLKKANIPMTKLGWAFDPDVYTILYNEVFPNGNYKFRDELKQGKFHGYPYCETNQIATGTDDHGKTDIFFGDFDQFFIGEQLALEVKTSEDATYLDENGALQSAFDNDETVVKGMMIHDFGVAYGKAFSLGNYYTK